jgi:hypothetical protein
MYTISAKKTHDTVTSPWRRKNWRSLSLTIQPYSIGEPSPQNMSNIYTDSLWIPETLWCRILLVPLRRQSWGCLKLWHKGWERKGRQLLSDGPSCFICRLCQYWRNATSSSPAIFFNTRERCHKIDYLKLHQSASSTFHSVLFRHSSDKWLGTTAHPALRVNCMSRHAALNFCFPTFRSNVITAVAITWCFWRNITVY